MGELIPVQLAGYPPIFVIETCVVVLALIGALLVPRAFDNPFLRIEARLGALANRPVLSLVLAGLAPILLRLALQPLLHLPQPHVHDEFSYLLASDTFARGRVTNPPHPLWVFFENMHILQQPSYASQYQPLQGIFLACGQLLTGLPWAGVLLSMGLFCAALLWMLRAWVPPTWALLGTALAVIRIGIFSYWMNSYWGGAPSALAGALVAGSIPRIFRTGRARYAVILGVGMILFAASRPYEGLWFSLPFAIAVLLWCARKKAWTVALPLTAVLLTGLIALAYYNWRVTGHALEFPEHAVKMQYAVTSDFLGIPPKPAPRYNHEVMRHYYVEEEPTFAMDVQSTRDLAKSLYEKCLVFVDFYIGPLLAVPILLAGAAFLGRPMRLLLLGLACVGVAIATERWHPNPHYFAPATCAFYALMVSALARIWQSGRFIVRAIVIAAVVMAGIRVAHEPLDLELSPLPMNWSAPWPGPAGRAHLIEALNRQPERFLVIVRYLPGHPYGDEWVYNQAVIDAAKIVWAHDMGSESNRRLLDYFVGRRVLLLERDAEGAVASEYPR